MIASNVIIILLKMAKSFYLISLKYYNIIDKMIEIKKLKKIQEQKNKDE
jgi:hypothetical protein